MLTIRLSRTGKRHKPQYRIVVQEKHRDPWSPALDTVGTYNPHTKPSTIELKKDRIKHWLEKGAQPSNTVHNMLVNAGLIKEDKVKAIAISNKRAGKLEEKKAEDAEKKAEAKVKAAEARETAKEAKKAKEVAAAEAAKAEKVEEVKEEVIDESKEVKKEVVEEPKEAEKVKEVKESDKKKEGEKKEEK